MCLFVVSQNNKISPDKRLSAPLQTLVKLFGSDPSESKLLGEIQTKVSLCTDGLVPCRPGYWRAIYLVEALLQDGWCSRGSFDLRHAWALWSDRAA